MKWLTGLLFTIICLGQTTKVCQAAPWEFQKGDHISIIGNTLADRMQHHSWLEAYLYAKFPEHQLVFRNLGFSADEIDLKKRLRSANFGTPNHWLTFCKTDVIFAFFGYNESFAGKEGLPEFKKELENFINETLNQKYNDKSAPRLILFSPIAHENLQNKHLSDGKENNARIKLYTEAMAEVAAAKKVEFVDLFTLTQKLYERNKPGLTFNGIHLTEKGYKLVAEALIEQMYGKPTQELLDKAKAIYPAVQDKNFHWFERYRTTDGYSIFGGRASLRFAPDNQSNRVVAQREMEVLDILTANRDDHIHELLKGNLKHQINDSNTPPFIPVKTNFPGQGPNGQHIFLSGEQAIGKMTLGKNLKINLFASEEQFPELSKPVQMSWDAKGRLWVAVWPSYPHWKPKEEMNDKILILEDVDGDGKADKCTVFADKLHNPTGFEFCNGGVLVAQAPDIMFLKDTDGDDKADYRERVISGMDSADTHHTSNSFVLDPGGAIYFQEGTFHHTQVETPYGPSRRNVNAGVYRYEPKTQKFDVYVTFGFANPHGHVFDRWGQDIIIDGTGSNPYHGALFSGHLEYPQKHNRPPQVYQQRTRPCPGMEILSSSHFPDEYQGNLLVANVINFRGILRYQLADEGGSLAAKEVEPILYSSDPNFRPSDLRIGPDGAIYFLDWQNPIIGHMQHNLRDPSRDRIHGRIYRVIYESRPLLKSPKIVGEPIEKLLQLLRSPEDRVRSRVKIELGSRNSDEVLKALKNWLPTIQGKDSKNSEAEHLLLEALWVHQYIDEVNADLLKRVLSSSEYRARAAATRVLVYWRDRIPDSLGLLRKLAADPEARVRLEAVRGASFYTEPEAMEILFIAMDQPKDRFVDFVIMESMRTLDPIWKSALANHRPINLHTDIARRYLLKTISTEELLKMKPTQAVCLEMLYRSNIQDQDRRVALGTLAKLENKQELPVLLEVIRRVDDNQESRDPGIMFDLIRLLNGRTPNELREVRKDLEKLATGAKKNAIRQMGYLALLAVDGNVNEAWKLALSSPQAMMDLLDAVPLVVNPALKSALYPLLEPLLRSLPKEMVANNNAQPSARYVRIELPGRNKTLTLAEVEIFSDGKNIARQGKAKQKNVGFGGEASRAIDGNTDGSYSANGQSHSEENTTSPWLEIDLGKVYPIEKVVIFNRTDGDFYKRLNGYTLKLLDGNHKVVMERSKQKAQPVAVTHVLGSESSERGIRRRTMIALTSVRGQETKTFQLLTPWLSNDTTRYDAIRALTRLPRNTWPKENAGALVETVLAVLRKIPVAERTSTEALETMEFAYSLTNLLDLDTGKKTRKELGELGVRVIRIGTLLERMSYDKEVVVVQAGKPVAFILQNNDMMPHNFVITNPGAMEPIGLLAEKEANNPSFANQNFVPKSNRILLASKLLQPGDSQKLTFTVPNKPGVYPYVCTYPGHWRRMYGALYVVPDMDSYLANPDGYLASAKLPILDDLLKDRRPRTEWKYTDLVNEVTAMKEGRSYANGKHLFTVATCISCHQMEGVGQNFGPELIKLDPKTKLTDLLMSMVEPSAKIDDKYKMYRFDLVSGKTVTGMILEEDKKQVKVIENPLAKAAATIIKLEDIESRKASPVSLMPKGLLDKLTRDEILDLIAYVYSRGNAKHPIFQGGGHDHHTGSSGSHSSNHRSGISGSTHLSTGVPKAINTNESNSAAHTGSGSHSLHPHSSNHK